jgi:predicted glycosyltransferase
MNIPTYVFYDTEHATISNLLSYPFATCIYVPQCYRKQIRWNHVRYNGYHELAYLHPKYFKADPSVLEEAGLQHDEIFTIVRFVGWGAAHDVGVGFYTVNKIRAVRELSRYGRVLISCEGELPAELETYRLRLNVAKIHHLMAYASLIFGESATMASEGAVMGIPGVFLDPVGRGYTDEQENKYHIVFNFTPDNQDEAIAKAVSILKDYRKEYWRDIGRQIVKDKIDVTEMMYEIAIDRPFTHQAEPL